VAIAFSGTMARIPARSPMHSSLKRRLDCRRCQTWSIARSRPERRSACPFQLDFAVNTQRPSLMDSLFSGWGESSVPELVNKSTQSPSTLADLPVHTCTMEYDVRTQQVKSEFDQRPDLPGIIILRRGELYGFVSRDSLFRNLSQPFCRELFLRKPISEFLKSFQSNLLVLDAGCSLHAAAEAALGRP